MVKRIVPQEPSFDESLSYIDDVKKAFHDEPGKYDQFKKLLNDYRAKRVDSTSLVASVKELMRYHLNLLPGFSFFHQKAKKPPRSDAVDHPKKIRPNFPPQVNTTIPPETKTTFPPQVNTTIPLDVNRTNPPEPNRTIAPEPNRTIPPEVNRTILNDANKGIGQLLGRKVPSEVTTDDSIAYIAAVKEAFNDEPDNYQVFLQILNYLDTQTDSEAEALCYASVKELMKGHPNLFLGFNAFLPAEAIRVIPPKAIRATPLNAIRPIPIAPEAKTTALPEVKATTTPEAKITIKFKSNKITYPLAKTSIHPEAYRTTPPEDERTIRTEANRTIPTVANAITLPVDRLTIIPKAKRTIPSHGEHHGAVPNCTKRKRVEPEDSMDFIKKLQTRFRTIDTHVVPSFCKIMNKFLEGEWSETEVHREGVDLLYYHEDLIEDFSRFFKKKKILPFY